MPNVKDALKIQVYEDYNTTLLEDDLSAVWTRLSFSSALHGGFKDCRMMVPMGLEQAWMWLSREGAVGRHYDHLVIRDGVDVIWEGRIMDISLQVDSGVVGLDITAMGYYSSLRDQMYSASDGGNTDWTVSGPHNTGKVIRELMTKSCPDINGTADVTLTPDNIVGIDLTARSYPMDILIDKLAPLAGTGADVYYFGIWESRKPYWTARAVANVDWHVTMGDIERLNLTQDGKNLRNKIIPKVGTAEGTSTTNAESTALYPRRDIVQVLQVGVPTTAANNARDAMVTERKNPVQDEAFTVKGHVYSTKVGNLAQGTGSALQEKPKWWVRAGDVIRIKDLVPYSAATGTLDNLRTFYILEANYNAERDVLELQPDRPPSMLGAILARMGTLEKQR